MEKYIVKSKPNQILVDQIINTIHKTERLEHTKVNREELDAALTQVEDLVSEVDRLKGILDNLRFETWTVTYADGTTADKVVALQ